MPEYPSAEFLADTFCAPFNCRGGATKSARKRCALANGALREPGFRSRAEPVLYRIARPASPPEMGVPEGRQVLVYLVQAPELSGPRRFIDERPRDQREIGRGPPAHSRAPGKVLPAYLARAALRDCLAGFKVPFRQDSGRRSGRIYGRRSGSDPGEWQPSAAIWKAPRRLIALVAERRARHFQQCVNAASFAMQNQTAVLIQLH